MCMFYSGLFLVLLQQASECGAPLQEGSEGGSRELQACQPDLGARKGHGADHLECHYAIRAGQPGDWAQPA